MSIIPKFSISFCVCPSCFIFPITINSILGYSGKIIDLEHLSKNIVSRPNIFLMHGDIDQVVPVDGLLEAKNFFN